MLIHFLIKWWEGKIPNDKPLFVQDDEEYFRRLMYSLSLEQLPEFLVHNNNWIRDLAKGVLDHQIKSEKR